MSTTEKVEKVFEDEDKKIGTAASTTPALIHDDKRKEDGWSSSSSSENHVPAIDLSKYSTWELAWDMMFYSHKPLDTIDPSKLTPNKEKFETSVLTEPPSGWRANRHRLVSTGKVSIPLKGKPCGVFKWEEGSQQWVLEFLVFPDVADTYGTRDSDIHARLTTACSQMKARSFGTFCILLPKEAAT